MGIRIRRVAYRTNPPGWPRTTTVSWLRFLHTDTIGPWSGSRYQPPYGPSPYASRSNPMISGLSMVDPFDVLAGAQHLVGGAAARQDPGPCRFRRHGGRRGS